MTTHPNDLSGQKAQHTFPAKNQQLPLRFYASISSAALALKAFNPASAGLC